MLASLIADKTLTAKEKTPLISRHLLDGSLAIGDWSAFVTTAKDPAKATCMEALEMASRENASLVDRAAFEVVVDSLGAKAPRVKWESARVIANTAGSFPKHLDAAISGLLDNTEHTGTVVRWSAATALAVILRLKTRHNKELVPAARAICEREEKNSIKKIYLQAFKSIGA